MRGWTAVQVRSATLPQATSQHVAHGEDTDGPRSLKGSDTRRKTSGLRFPMTIRPAKVPLKMPTTRAP